MYREGESHESTHRMYDWRCDTTPLLGGTRTSCRQTCLRSMLPPLGWARWNSPSSPPSVSASGFGSVSSPSASDLHAPDQDFVKASKPGAVTGLMAEGDS